MARFISFTQRKTTASGEKEEIVFINIDLVSTACYRDDGSLSLAIHGTKDISGAVEHFILHGEEAAAAVKLLQNTK